MKKKTTFNETEESIFTARWLFVLIPESALIRELEEEIGMQIKILSFLGSKIHQYDSFSIELIAYECDFIAASFHLTDHDKSEFVNPKDLTNYKIAPADLFIVCQLI